MPGENSVTPVTDEEVVRVKDIIVDIRSYLALRYPFLCSLLSRVRILATRVIPTMAVDKEYNLLVNPDYFTLKAATLRDKAFSLTHETLHLAFNHPGKGEGKKHPEVWVYSCEVPVNTIAYACFTPSSKLWCGLVTADTVNNKVMLSVAAVEKILGRRLTGSETPRFPAPDKLKKWSAEEVYRELYKMPPVPISSFGEGKGGAGSPFTGEGCTPRDAGEDAKEVQPGDGSIYKKGDNRERGKEWGEAFMRDYLTHKSIGTLPAGLGDVVDNLLKPTVDWRALLRQALRDGEGRTIVTTWRRPSRKIPGMPGLRRLASPPIRVLMDTSGSIGGEQLERFMSEVYAIARFGRVIWTCWDAKAYDDVVANNPLEVKRVLCKRITGRGGTMIEPALRKCLKSMRGESVVILTDGYIGDVAKVGGLMREIAARAPAAVFATVGERHEFDRWVTIEVAAT